MKQFMRKRNKNTFEMHNSFRASIHNRKLFISLSTHLISFYSIFCVSKHDFTPNNKLKRKISFSLFYLLFFYSGKIIFSSIVGMNIIFT
jgi:hypothetical protein